MNEAKTILVLEMYQPVVDVLQIVLQESGYAVQAASSIEEARKILSTCPPALLLISVDIGISSIVELIGWIRTKEGPHLPIVILGFDDDARLLANSAEVDGWIRMPFDIDDIIDIVNRLIS